MNVTQPLHMLLPDFQSFLAVASRTGGIVAAFPMLSGRAVPPRIKVALVVMLSLVSAPAIHLPQIPHEAIAMTAGLAGELLIGLVIGMAVRLLFSALEVAGELIGTQMGFSMAQLLDPMTSVSTPMVGQLFTVIASLVFLSLNAHMMVVAAIVSSYESIPPFGARLSPVIGEEVLRLSQHMFVVAVQLSGPALVALALINILLAMLGRAVTQINVFVLSFPLTIAAGLLVLGLAMPFIVSRLEREFIGLHETIEGLLRALGHG
ncbi:MAG: flagellar biosynthetic protein FliR [Nitrospirota bacterium]|nr:flagellar biosynthetic protein FliR [Nitrospirota bacterium]